MFEQNKTPYRGRWVVILALILPSVLCTWICYSLIMKFQAEYGAELNWASAKAIGCGIGIIFHLSCWIGEVFSQDAMVVKNRLKEFFSDLSVSAKLAFTWYFEDIKANGMIYWLYILLIGINICIFADALRDCFVILGWTF